LPIKTKFSENASRKNA